MNTREQRTEESLWEEVVFLRKETAQKSIELAAKDAEIEREKTEAMEWKLRWGRTHAENIDLRSRLAVAEGKG